MLDQPDVLFPDVLQHNARIYGDHPAVVCGDDRLTWGEFGRQTNRVANALLGGGLKKGDRVCLLMENSITAFVLLWGAVKAGGVVAPLNVMMSRDSIPTMLNNAAPKFIFVDENTQEVLESIRESVHADPGAFYSIAAPSPAWGDGRKLIETASSDEVYEDIAQADSMSIIYSSGTTETPKGIEHSHLARHIFTFGCGPMLKIDRYSVALCSTPLYTNGTWVTMLPTLFMGGTVVLSKKFSGKGFLDTVEREGVTHAFIVPTQLIGILAEPSLADHDTSSLRVFLSGGAPLTSQTLADVTEAFPGTGVHEMYGFSEGFIAMALPEDRERGKVGTVGKPIFGGDVRTIDSVGNELAVGETGEFVGWSPGLMKGYFREAERTKEMIWKGPGGRTYLRSGDVGRIDEDGFVFVSGRVKDMIISGGINVYASDIEEVFMKHPQVQEVTAIGIPHEKWGETPLLLAIMHEGATIGEEELTRWGNDRIGKYQRVSAVEFRDSFPRAAHNKVLKRALRDPYWAGKERAI
jgi:acyl-CoA synthetase (AMP-forming)/AMP-acid ligase II